MIWVIEYQKRGMPHVHISLTWHPSTAAIIDEHISTELPYVHISLT